jgi:hypothetical protein
MEERNAGPHVHNRMMKIRKVGKPGHTFRKKKGGKKVPKEERKIGRPAYIFR